MRARFSLLVLLVAAALALGGAAGAPRWVELGPAPVRTAGPVGFTGRVAALAVSRHDPDTYFAATASGGVWLSHDGGQSWSPRSDRLPTTALGAIALDPRDERIVYAGSGEANYAYHSLYGAGVYKSTDGGRTFRVFAKSFEGQAFSRLAVGPDGTVWAAVSRAGGSADGMEAANLGLSWETLNSGLGAVQYYAGLAVSPVTPDFIAVGSQDNGTHLRRADGSWVQVFGGDGGWVAARPDDPNAFVVQFQGTGTVFLTRDGGRSFNRVSQGIDPNDRTAFQAPLLFDPVRPGGDFSGELFYATQRLYISDGAVAAFRPISGDLTSGRPWAIRSLAVSPTDEGTLYATTNDDAVLVSSDRGANWTQVLSGIAGWPRIMRQVAIDPEDADVAAVVDGGFGGARVLLSRDHGATWTEIGRRLPDLPFSAVAIHRFSGKRQIFIGADRGVYATANDGASWIPYGVGLPNVPVHDVVVDAAHGRLVVATLGRGVWQSPLVAVRSGG